MIANPQNQSLDEVIASVTKTVQKEEQGLQRLIDALKNGLGDAVTTCVNAILRAKGRVIVTGVGKSGHIGSKIAATFASTGTPAFFLHAAEANHGDLGMITNDDVVIALSWGGESGELKAIVEYASRFSIPLFAITANPKSSLGLASTKALTLPKSEEACPNGLAPTTSTMMQLAIGDAIAIALLEARKFGAREFSIFHPGGKLGASLRQVHELMHAGDALPLVSRETDMQQAVDVMSEKGLGCVGVVDGEKLIGIITDGDLRRKLDVNLLTLSLEEVMTPSPVTVTRDTLAASALEVMNSSGNAGITALFIVEDGTPVGIVHIHDLLRSGVA